MDYDNKKTIDEMKDTLDSIHDKVNALIEYYSWNYYECKDLSEVKSKLSDIALLSGGEGKVVITWNDNGYTLKQRKEGYDV